MIPVNQKFLQEPDNGSIGDCWRACIASVLELPIDDVPHFGELDVRIGMKMQLLLLHEHGLTLYSMYGEGSMSNHPEMQKDDHEYYFAIGPSPRDKNVNHQVVCHKGKIVHDPHPDKTGLAGISHFEILLKLKQYVRKQK